MMIELDNILTRVQEIDLASVLEEMMQTPGERYLAAGLEDYGCRILDNSSPPGGNDYLLLAVYGDNAQVEMQAAAQLAILPCLFVNWQAQLAQINYYMFNPGEFQGMPRKDLISIIEARNFSRDTARLGNYACQLDCPVYEVLDIRNGEIGFTEYSSIEPFEYPLFCILPAENRNQIMETAVNISRASEAFKKLNCYNLQLLYIAAE